jgi:hypothetical protein
VINKNEYNSRTFRKEVHTNKLSKNKDLRTGINEALNKLLQNIEEIKFLIPKKISKPNKRTLRKERPWIGGGF